MRDYAQYLVEFNKFVTFIIHSGRTPTESDVDYFIEQMWMKSWWKYDDNDFSGSGMLRGCDAYIDTLGVKVLDKTDLSHTQYKEETKPLLIGKLLEVVGEVGKIGRPVKWDTLPESVAEKAARYARQAGMTMEEWDAIPHKHRIETEVWAKADGDTVRIKHRIAEYNQKVIPFQLRKTMHHPVGIVGYSTTKGTAHIRRKFLKVHDEADIDDFMDDNVDAGTRAIWFVPSETGLHLKIGIVDIDYHGVDVSDKEKKRVVKEVSKRFQKAGHPILIQYSGDGYHVWFGKAGATELGDIHMVKNYINSLLYSIKGLTTNKTEAQAMNIAHLDIGSLKRNGPWGMFFGLHYKPLDKQTDRVGTGYARVPLTLDTILTFDPQHDAHPEVVLKNFDSLSILVSRFFDTVQVGQGYEDETSLEDTPPCSRSEGTEPTHPLPLAAEKWKKTPAWSQLRWDDAKEKFHDKSGFIVTPKFDGWLCAIHYKEGGGHKVGGKLLKQTQSRMTRSGMMEDVLPVKTIMSTRRGIVLWDNHITREFESICARKGIKEALLMGELFTYDAFGRVKGPHAVTSVINRSEIDPAMFKTLRYVLVDAVSIDSQDVSGIPYQQRHAELEKFEGDRISVVPLHILNESPLLQLEALWVDITVNDAQEGLVIHHEGKRYKVKYRHTLDAVIIGVNKTSKSWFDKKKTRHVFHVAVFKKTKYGPTLINLGTVGWGPGFDNEKQVELFDRVVGEPLDSETRPFTNVIPVQGAESLEDILLVDPMVVVEIEYTKLSDKTTPTFGMFYLQETAKDKTITTQWGKKTITSMQGYRMHPKVFVSRRMLGPALITRIRDDKDAEHPEDIRHEQAKGAGGLAISMAKKNPSVVDDKDVPRWLRPLIRWFPITFSSSSPQTRFLILDKSLSHMTFAMEKPMEFGEPWAAPIEMYRKLWNIAKRAGKKEYGGFVNEGTIYYGSTHSFGEIGFISTADTAGCDFRFHTHPRPDFKTGKRFQWPLLSPADLGLALRGRVTTGVAWDCVVEPYGFDFYRVVPKKGTPLGNALIHYQKKKGKVTEQWLGKLEKVLTKSASKFDKIANKIYDKWLKTDLSIDAFHPSWETNELMDKINEKSTEFFIEYIHIPLPLVGYLIPPEKRGAAIIRSNSSTGFYGVAKQRETLAAWPHVVGDPNRPETIRVSEGVLGPDGERMDKNIRFEEEFRLAIERGKRADPDEKGWKLYLPETRPGQQWSIQGGKGWPFVLGLPLNMHMDFADLYGGPGAAQVAMLRSEDGYIRSPTQQLNMTYADYDPAQNEKDLPLVEAASMESPTILKPDPDDKETWEPSEPNIYDESGRYARDLKEAIKTPSDFRTQKPEREEYLKVLYYDLAAKNNPPTGISEWDDRIAEFRDEYRMWEMEDIPQSWEEFAMGRFARWEVPLLEKGRKLAEAIDDFTLTSQEIARVRQQYSSTTLDVETPLESLLAPLLSGELEEDDEEDEEDEEGEEDVINTE